MADPATVSGLPPGFVLEGDPSATSVPAPVIPRTPAPQTPAQASKDTSDATTAANNATVSGFKVRQEGLTTEKQQAQKDMTTAGVDNLVSSIEDAKKLVNGWSTGVLGDVLHHVGGTDAAKLHALIDQEIKGNVFLTTLQQRQQDSPTGTGSTPGGRVLQSEVPMITGALGTLDPAALGPEMTTQKLNQVAYRALRAKAILNGEDPSDPGVQKKYGIDKYAATLPPTDVIGGPSHDAGSIPPAPGATPPNTPPGTPPLTPGAPGTEIKFNDEMPNSTRASRFQDSLTAALSAQQLKTPDDVNKWVSQFNQQNGTQFAINWNDPSTQKALEAAVGGKQFNVAKPIDPEVTAKIAAAKKQGDNTGAAAVVGAGDALTVGALPRAAAAGDALVDSLSGKGSFSDRYNVNLDANRGYMDTLNSDHPVGYIGGELAGGLALPSFGARTPMALAKVGAAYGGAYGAMQGDSGTPLTNRFMNTATGATIGGAVGGVAGKVLGPKGAQEVAPSANTPQEVAQAFQAEGIPAARPFADPSARANMSYLETTNGGNNIVRNSINQTRRGIADRFAAVAGDGTAQTPGQMGQTIQDAGTSTLAAAKEAAKGVYTQAEASAGNTPITPTNALNKLDSYIAKLSRNPDTNAGVLSYLKGVRGDLTVPENHPVDTGLVDANGNAIMRPGAPPEPKTLADLRDIVTGANDKISFQNLQKTRAEGIMTDVGKSLNEDITNGLKDTNPNALGLYNKADGMWRNMSQLRQQVVSKLIGRADNPISGEATMSRVTNMMNNKGDLQRFGRVMNMMAPEEKSDFAATLFNNIGQRSSEEPFSPAYALAQTKNMQPEALKTAFGEDAAKSIQNLRVASQAFKDTTAQLNNSRTALATNWKSTVGSILNLKNSAGGLLGYAVGGPVGAVVGATGAAVGERAINGLSAKTLMNPDISSWIRKVAVAKSDADVPKLMGQLNKIAAANPALQSELGGLRNMLGSAVNDNVIRTGSVAASPNGGPNQQQ